LTGGVLATKSEVFTAKVLSIFNHALGGSRISRAPLGFAGAKPRLTAALAGCLLANFIACAALLASGSWVGAAARRSVLTPTHFYRIKIFVYNKSSSALPLRHLKNFTDAATQSLSRTVHESQQKGKIWVRANFAFLPKWAFSKNSKYQNLARGEM